MHRGWMLYLSARLRLHCVRAPNDWLSRLPMSFVGMIQDLSVQPGLLIYLHTYGFPKA